MHNSPLLVVALFFYRTQPSDKMRTRTHLVRITKSQNCCIIVFCFSLARAKFSIMPLWVVGKLRARGTGCFWNSLLINSRIFSLSACKTACTHAGMRGVITQSVLHADKAPLRTRAILF